MILHWVFFSLFHCIGLYSDNSAPYSDIALYHQGDRICGSQTVKLSATMLYYNRRDRIKTMAMRLMVCGCAVFRWKWAIKRVIRQRAVAKVTVGFIDDIELYPVLYSIYIDDVLSVLSAGSYHTPYLRISAPSCCDPNVLCCAVR